MANADVNIKLKLKDEATKGIQSFQKSMALAAASVVALKKAFDTLKFGAIVQQQRDAFNSLGETYAFNSEKMVDSMREVADGTISSFDLILNASKALSLGIKADALPELLEISRKAARVMGEDAQFMFQSISIGIGRQSKLILDNLGIIIDAQKAYDNYANVLGKTAEQLNDTEKKQAFLNEAVRQGNEKFKDTNLSQATTKESLDKVIVGFKELGETLSVLVANGKATNAWLQGVGFILKGLNQIIKGDSPIVKLTNQLKFYSEELRRLMVSSENDGPFNRRNQEDINRTTEKIRELNKEIVKIQDASRTADIARAVKKSQMAFFIAEDEKQKKMKETSDKMFDENKAMMEFSTSTARGMQAEFSNRFFNAMKGDINSLGDSFSDFGNYVLRVLSQVITKLLMVKMLKGVAGMFGEGSAVGGFITEVAGEFADGGRPPIGRASLVGERGPELFVPDGAGTIIPNGKFGSSSGGGGGSQIAVASPTVYNITQNIQAPAQMNLAQLSSMIVNEIKTRGSINQAIRSSV